MKSEHFMFLLFLPAIVCAIAAFASDQPETKGKFLKAAIVFICLLFLVIPIRFWRDFTAWLFHHN